MRILILHRIPYKLIRYAEGIDHLLHEVTYVGTSERLANLPPDLPCTRLERPGVGGVADEVLAAVRGRATPDLVIALSEYELMGAAEVRAALGVRGDHPEAVIPVRDKVVMKGAVARAGWRVPGYMPLPEALAASHPAWTGPTVLKPLDGASSEQVYSFPTMADALAAVRNGAVPAGIEPERNEVEEFVSGPIIHVDGMVVEGEPVAVQASRYVGTCLGYAQGSPLGSVQTDTPPSLVSWTTGCLEAVGIRTGLFHLEGIESDRGMVFLEVGARFGGADVVDTFELATGVHLPSAHLRILTGDRRSRPLVRTPDPASRYGWFVWPGHLLGGQHCRIRGEEAFRDSALVWRWTQREPGESVKPAISYSDTDVPLAAIVGGAPGDTLERFLSDLFSTVRVDAVEDSELSRA